MSAKITPITTAPAAFSGIVAKLNEVIAANPPLQAGSGIKIDTAQQNRIVSLNLDFEEFTICENGTPAQILIAVRRL